MSTAPVSLRHIGAAQVDEVRGILLGVYAEVYADRLATPFFSLDRFDARLDAQLRSANWSAVIGFAGETPVGYAYGATRPAGSTSWRNVQPSLSPSVQYESGQRTFYLFELMVRAPWRGTGTALRLHDELLSRRTEQRAALTVEHDHPRVVQLYHSWGYRYAGSQRPTPDAPLLDLMLRDPLYPPPPAA